MEWCSLVAIFYDSFHQSINHIVTFQNSQVSSVAPSHESKLRRELPLSKLMGSDTHLWRYVSLSALTDDSKDEGD